MASRSPGAAVRGPAPRAAGMAPVLLLVLAAALGGCATRPAAESPTPSPPAGGPSASASTPVTPEPTDQEPEPDPGPEPRPVTPRQFDQREAMAVVRHLAVDIGPRHGTSPAFGRAADWVARRFDSLGYAVSRERFDVPGGVSWGVPVAAGRSQNVVAVPEGLDPSRPHLVVGAHLDTVPPAPGAEDNASGVGVLLTAAEAAVGRRTRLPVVWVAFGAEEPRGPTDADHHYGSRAHVAAMPGAQRRALRGMVAIDRVGVGAVVPVGSASAADPVQRSLLAAGRRAEVPTVAVPESRSSDHWSFVKAQLPAARLGSTSYAAYHSAADLPDVVDPAQLGRTGRLLLAWLAPQGAR